MTTEHTKGQEHADQADHAGMSVKRIWIVFAYLLGITSLEFIIALVLIPMGLNHGLANFTYISLTLLKAYYIIAYFMHLRFEKSAMITAVTVGLIFIVYFIVLMLTEGSYLNLHMNQ
ncbi:hypothetical protein ADIARSV_1705 [Arcticibacter svalbardensis MN12-7]|uniref:Caa(3)-type oxidase, subunit IV n=1 Tax=Arcticibacter svalbardensis MN12-7 TaxID=1150600 RepID=R9GTQ4_9SPHI|nr:cytochrome C oxidase subunit IV family protein [Arcticibacter svalbardensis]EOR95217.1 hypothetical protein ADIARSV_1705 [Arcticibacter svalbardensis MN12-7]